MLSNELQTKQAQVRSQELKKENTQLQKRINQLVSLFAIIYLFINMTIY